MYFDDELGFILNVCRSGRREFDLGVSVGLLLLSILLSPSSSPFLYEYSPCSFNFHVSFLACAKWNMSGC